MYAASSVRYRRALQRPDALLPTRAWSFACTFGIEMIVLSHPRTSHRIAKRTRLPGSRTVLVGA